MSIPNSYWTTERLLTTQDIERFEQVPLEERGLPESTYQMLMDGCAINPDKVAVQEFSDGVRPLETSREVTFAGLRRKIHQTANLLFELGVGSSDVVSLLMPAVLESQYVLWGAQAAGIVNPVNWMLESDIMAHTLQAANTKVLIVYGGDEYTQIWHKLEAVVPRLAGLTAIIRIGGELPGPQQACGIPVIQYESVIESYEGDYLVSGRKFGRNEIAALFHTGGTTGAPKLAPVLHRNQVFWVWASALLTGFADEEVRLIGVPIFHVAGCVAGCFSPLSRGSRLVLMTSAGYRHPSVVPNLWKLIETFRATTVNLVPTLVNQLLSLPINGADLSSLRYASSSTAPLSVTAAETFYRLTGVRIRESYGQTETTAVTFITPPVDKIKVGSSGLRLPYQHVRIVQLDRDGSIERECEVGEPGLVLVRGPAVFPGYLGPRKVEHWFEGDWLNTGDLGYLDDEAWLYITGRAKDLIIRGGHNIDPKMVEEALFAVEAIQDVAVVGAPDRHAGEVPVAYVVFRPDASSDPQHILQHAARHVPERAAVPKHCYVLEEMPKSSVGKILKNQLRVDAARRSYLDVLHAALPDVALDVSVQDKGAAGLLVEVQVNGPGRICHADIEQVLLGFSHPVSIRSTYGE